MRWACCGLLVLACAVPAWPVSAPGRMEVKVSRDRTTFSVYRKSDLLPLLLCQAPLDGRACIHPIMAPDGRGELTEYAPAHHKHQTGLFVGFVKVNGRDYFHNRGRDHFRRLGGAVTGEDDDAAFWDFGQYWLGKDKEPILLETQVWRARDRGDYYVLDLDWKGRALVEVTFGRYDYGGLFLRMPWRAKTGGKAVNSAGQFNDKAEGKKARWVDVGVPIADRGKDDWGHIAILDHKDNRGHPVLWRVDGQLGVGPAPSRAGEWKLARGETARLRYRLVIYTGALNTKRVEAEWKQFTSGGK